jgi:hypothetical protein
MYVIISRQASEDILLLTAPLSKLQLRGQNTETSV